MAQKAAKQLAVRNTAILNRAHAISVGINLLFILLRLLIFRSSNTRATLLLYILLSLPGFIIEFWLERIGRPTHGANGELKRSGEDLEAKGLTEFMWDVLYWTWGCVVAATVLGNKGWWLWAVIPVYGVWLAYTTFGSVRKELDTMVQRVVSHAGCELHPPASMARDSGCGILDAQPSQRHRYENADHVRQCMISPDLTQMLPGVLHARVPQALAGAPVLFQGALRPQPGYSWWTFSTTGNGPSESAVEHDIDGLAQAVVKTRNQKLDRGSKYWRLFDLLNWKTAYQGDYVRVAKFEEQSSCWDLFFENDLME